MYVRMCAAARYQVACHPCLKTNLFLYNHQVRDVCVCTCVYMCVRVRVRVRVYVYMYVYARARVCVMETG